MNEYAGFASVYDQLTGDVPYQEWLDQYDRIWNNHGGQPKLLLDLACGTGTLSCMLARRGIDVIGVDRSPDMLSAAQRKAEGIMPAPLFICQGMDELDLYGTVDGAICALDSINYIGSSKELVRIFGRVSLFLEPGRVFIFDINTERKLRSLDGKTIVKETEDLFCVWQNDYNAKRRQCLFTIDVFYKANNDIVNNCMAINCRYGRISEFHYEHAYSLKTIKAALDISGLELAGVYPSEGANDIKQADRLFIAAIKR